IRQRVSVKQYKENRDLVLKPQSAVVFCVLALKYSKRVRPIVSRHE
ncbi:hypothetical protein Csa_023884, partial [Cucumis sativus]